MVAVANTSFVVGAFQIVGRLNQADGVGAHCIAPQQANSCRDAIFRVRFLPDHPLCQNIEMHPFVVAVTSPHDRNHDACVRIYRQQPFIYLLQSTLHETAYLLHREMGSRSVVQFLRSLPTTKYRPLALEPDDRTRTADILEQYADSRVDFVDATVAAVAGRLKIARILTLDRRDFGMLRPAHVDYFALLP